MLGDAVTDLVELRQAVAQNGLLTLTTILSHIQPNGGPISEPSNADSSH